MKKIKLTQGKVALVDESDAHLVTPFKWFAYKAGRSWYAGTNIRVKKGRGGQRMVRMHHLILPKRPGFVVDHRDRNGLNNGRSNLRYATRGQNRSNSLKNKGSVYKGVSWHKRVKKWVAICGHKHRGYFDDPLAAALVYDWWAKRIHGEFAKTNF